MPAGLLQSFDRNIIHLPQTEDEKNGEFYECSVNGKSMTEAMLALLRVESVAGSCTLITINGDFMCRKGFFALNVQTVSDPNLSIRNIVVRWPGSTHDSTVFDHSYLRAHVETEVPSSYHLLGDSGYPLRSYLMTPFLNPVGAGQTAQTVMVATAVLHNLALSLGDDEDSHPLQQDDTMVNHSQEHGGIAKRNAIVANFFD
ncbi:DDE Tnp4 domain-containing protein [Trichonephila clavipes]|nr:DDE Tnp4 domain-containing protein [Trichonephila clavipes]